ncbi:MAG: alpha/beta hydrolase-fold protein, partial [Hyphomonadaceae bacterium]|nr:alpha/beta hydrolase-fold protein [Hyphomonadaceae bacterium]
MIKLGWQRAACGKTIFAGFAAVLFLAGCQSVASGVAAVVPDAGRQIVLGRGYEIASTALGETRQVNVYVPADYATSEKSYPVLYLIDGGVDQDFIHIAGLSQHASISGSFREMIVVGIATQDRRRELTFPANNDDTLRKEYPTHGESAKFRAFIASEVKPWVERSYRTDGYD